MEKQWICSICGYVYEKENFNIEGNDYRCPLCDASRNEFKERDVEDEIIQATNELLEKSNIQGE